MNSNNNKKLKIVCVSNDLSVFNKVIASNQNISKYAIKMFDNSIENIGISKRYNDFIKNNITTESDFWIIFCHQDFGFKEDPINKLNLLDKENIYGPIGIGNKFNLYKGLKNKLFQLIGFYPVFRFMRKDDSGRFRLFYIKKESIKKGFLYSKLYGQILQGRNDSTFKKTGKKIKFTTPAVVLDCCCMIVHSSVINKHNLKFDEKLNWHMYIEDFCLGAKVNHNISTKVVQLDCYHLGEGILNDDFYSAFDYVQNKYSLDYLKTTCYEK